MAGYRHDPPRLAGTVAQGDAHVIVHFELLGQMVHGEARAKVAGNAFGSVLDGDAARRSRQIELEIFDELAMPEDRHGFYPTFAFIAETGDKGVIGTGGFGKTFDQRREEIVAPRRTDISNHSVEIVLLGVNHPDNPLDEQPQGHAGQDNQRDVESHFQMNLPRPVRVKQSRQDVGTADPERSQTHIHQDDPTNHPFGNEWANIIARKFH